MAGAVLDNGGQIPRFIGDAALAIFLIEEVDDASRQSACEQAIAAAQEASSRIKFINQRRKLESEPAPDYGIALHVGDLKEL